MILKEIKYFIIPVLILFIWGCVKHAPQADWQGYLVKSPPEQTSGNIPAPFEYKGMTITPVANYSITGVTLGSKRYMFDRNSYISPIDVSLGWKKMSDAAVVNKIKLNQKVRNLTYYAPEGLPILESEIISSQSNNHCIPADNKIKKQLFSIDKYDLVTIKGYLVNVRGKNFKWDSSLSREDSGHNASELIWVTEVDFDKKYKKS